MRQYSWRRGQKPYTISKKLATMSKAPYDGCNFSCSLNILPHSVNDNADRAGIDS